MNPGQTFFHSCTWCLAIVFAVILNIFLFGIMPGMIQKIPEKPDDLENIKAIQVIRIKRAETPVRKKQQKKTREPEKNPEKIQKQIKVFKPEPMKLKPKLPFELNPELPTSINSLEMPPMENFTLKTPSLKGLYFTSELDAPLTPIVKIPPVYPMRATRRGIEGWVKVQFVVNTSGLVENLKIIESQPAGVFDKSVMNCVSQWKFKPGTVEGIPVMTRAETTIKFHLE